MDRQVVRFALRMAEQAAMWLAGCALILWTPAAFAGVLLLGIVYARNLEFVHECLHAIALPRPRHNAIVGHALGLPMLVSFERWRAEHMQHHRDVQIEGFQYEYARLTTWREYAVHVLMLRHFFDAVVRIAKLDRRYRFVTLAVLTVCALTVVTHSWLPIVLWVMPLPISAIIHTHIELPEHFGLEGIDSADPLQNSRVIPANRFVTWFVNANNYHAIHHWKPSLPIARLRNAFKALQGIETSSYRSFYKKFFSGLTLLVVILVGLTRAVQADDYGPHPDLREVRRELPIIMARVGPVAVDDVVVLGNEAIVQWHSGNKVGYEALQRRYDRWWLIGTSCFHWISPPSERVLEIASKHIPLLIPTPTPVPSSGAYYSGPGTILCTPASEGALSFRSFWQGDDSYELTLVPSASDAPKNEHVLNVRMRAPTEAESWMARGGNSYFFFYADVKAAAPIHVQPGTTIDVWFPFALNPNKRYSLTIGHTDAPIGPIDGTLKDNTLHFVLPAFGLTPGAHLMGEIEGDPDGP